jgi:hypothetical protein
MIKIEQLRRAHPPKFQKLLQTHGVPPIVEASCEERFTRGQESKWLSRFPLSPCIWQGRFRFKRQDQIILIHIRIRKETFLAKEAGGRALLAKADIRVDYGVEVSVTEWTLFYNFPGIKK